MGFISAYLIFIKVYNKYGQKTYFLDLVIKIFIIIIAVMLFMNYLRTNYKNGFTSSW